KGRERLCPAVTMLANLQLWEPLQRAETKPLRGHAGTVEALAMLPDGRLASAGGDDYTIRLCDPARRAQSARLASDWVHALAVLRDGRLASGGGGDGGSIQLWDTVRGVETLRIVNPDGAVASLAVLRDGRLAAGNQMGGNISLWDLARRTQTAHLEGH